MSSPRVEEASRLFSSGGGYNCAQAILAAFGPDYGLERTIALKLSSAFGSGMARTGGTCGAVTAAVMVLSLRYCTGEPKGILPKPVHKKAHKFVKAFEERFGTLNCSHLRGKEYDGTYCKGGNERCPDFVRVAAELLEEML